MKFPQNSNVTRLTVSRSANNGYFSFTKEDGTVLRTYNSFIFEALRSIKTEDKEVFQLCESGDLYQILTGDRTEHRTFLVHVTKGGSVLALSVDLNDRIGLSENEMGRYSYFHVSYGAFGGSADLNDESPTYYAHGDQFYNWTSAGLQRAVNCFFDRLNNDLPSKESVLWSGYHNLRDLFLMSVNLNEVITEDLLWEHSFMDIEQVGDELDLTIYRTNVLDPQTRDVQYTLALHQTKPKVLSDLTNGYNCEWVLTTEFKNPEHNTPTTVSFKLQQPGTMGALFDTMAVIGTTYQQLNCTPNEVRVTSNEEQLGEDQKE